MRVQRESLYPSTVPKVYLQYQHPEDFAKPLGHDTYVVLLKQESPDIAGNVTTSDLSGLRLSQSEAYATALENLEKLFKGGAIQA